MEDTDIKIRLILTNAALAAVIEEIANKNARLQVSQGEANDETPKARSQPLEKP